MEAVMETLTPHEISKILKLHPFTVTRLAREGKLPAFKVGGVWRVRKDLFERWIQRQTNGRGERRSRR
jgi:excisionase family DNA binding protein